MCSSAVMAGSEMAAGLVKSTVRWRPALRTMLSRRGYVERILLATKVSQSGR